MTINHSYTASAPIVIKLGGALLGDPSLLEPLWEALPTLRQEAPVLLVHGGGPQATAMAERLGHTPRIVHGRRVTTDLDLDVILWTLRGALNTRLVAEAARRGLPAVGLSGVDAGTVQVHRRPPWHIDGETVDFGWVGDVERVDPSLPASLLQKGYLPILAPLGIDAEGQLYNVNADTVACALSGALQAGRFFLVTESGGVRRVADRPDTLLSDCDAATYARGVEEGWIQGGMRVKLKVAFDALQAGAREVYILPPGLLLDPTRGTRIRA